MAKRTDERSLERVLRARSSKSTILVEHCKPAPLPAFMPADAFVHAAVARISCWRERFTAAGVSVRHPLSKRMRNDRHRENEWKLCTE